MRIGSTLSESCPITHGVYTGLYIETYTIEFTHQRSASSAKHVLPLVLCQRRNDPTTQNVFYKRHRCCCRIADEGLRRIDAQCCANRLLTYGKHVTNLASSCSSC